MKIEAGKVTPKTFGEMTPEEKGALLLAAHEGKDIEYWHSSRETWFPALMPCWSDWCAYRVKPKPIAELFMLYGNPNRDGTSWGAIDLHRDTHRITYQIIDGVVDCASIKMEPIE